MLPNERFPSSEFDDWAESYVKSASLEQFPYYVFQDVETRVIIWFRRD